MKYVIEFIRFIVFAMLLLLLGDLIVLLTVVLTKVIVIIGIGWLLIRMLVRIGEIHSIIKTNLARMI